MENKEKTEYVAVDLHVHTPASNCYKRKSTKIEEDYIALLKMYIEKGVKLIAITDHNTIEGYLKIKEIQKEAAETVKVLTKLKSQNVNGIDTLLLEQQSIVSLFKQITILPGVEFEAFPNIHLLLIFDPNEDDIENQIDKFLEESGYPKNQRGKETVSVSSKSATDIVNKAHDLGAITIAAHIDSTKGALEELKKGAARAQFLKNERLNGVQYIKPDTVPFIKNLFNNAEYKRTSNLAYIKSSDFHNKESIDGKLSFWKLNQYSFVGVKEIIELKPELISPTPNAEELDVLKERCTSTEAICFEKINTPLEIQQCICATLNQGKGTIVIGAKGNRDILGVKMDEETLKGEISNLFSFVKNKSAYFKKSEQYYILGDCTVAVIKLLTVGHIIFEFDEKVYLFNDKNKIVEASYSDVFCLGEANYRKAFENINRINLKRLKNIENNTKLLALTRNNIELNRKILLFSVNASNVFIIETIKHNQLSDYDTGTFGLGIPQSSYTPVIYKAHSFAEQPHFENIYNRITCRTFDIPLEMVAVDSDYNESFGECGIISYNFIIHYIAEIHNNYIDSDLGLLFRLSNTMKEDYSLPAILLWLKSPILLYHLYTIWGRFHLDSPKKFSLVPILLTDEFKLNGDLDRIANKMISLENEFLINKDKCVTSEEVYELMDQHNLDILKYVENAEAIFRRILNLTQEEYKAVIDFASQQKWLFFENLFQSK